MKIVGLTGSFGTGKTFAARVFRSLGAKVLDADKVARKVVSKGSPAYGRIAKAFGEKVLQKNGGLDRRALARIVFADRRKTGRLNAIVHPAVIKVLKDRIRSARERDIIVVDAPLFIEAGLAGMADYLVVVKCSSANQFKRCAAKFGISRKEIKKRIDRQMPLGKKIKMADFIIDNDGARSDTRKQIRKIWRKIAWR